jgi:hypothetical protein
MLAPARFEILIVIWSIPFPLCGHQRPLRAWVVALHDGFATARIYKWILMQLLTGFH